MTEMLTEVAEDLYETRTDRPFPGLTTHSYLWVRPQKNVLFYSPGSDADFDAIDALGGVAHQYLSHQDEAGPALARIRRRFGAQLHAPAAELAQISKHSVVDHPIDARAHDEDGVAVVPTPGHSPGSTSYLIRSRNGQQYLFTGDTTFAGDDGRWSTFLVHGVSDPAALVDSLRLLGSLTPDVVVSSAFGGTTAVHPMSGDEWVGHIDEALDSVPVRSE